MRRLGLALSAVLLLAAGLPTGAAARTKHWYVPFSLTQSGLPVAPQPPADLKATGSAVTGRILFVGKPKEGKQAGGTVKATMSHADQFQSQIATLKIRLKEGRCTLGAGSSSLFLTGSVSKVNDPGRHWSLVKKDPGIVRLTDKGTKKDAFSFIASHGKKSKHTHTYKSSGANILEVVIGDPKRL